MLLNEIQTRRLVDSFGLDMYITAVVKIWGAESQNGL